MLQFNRQKPPFTPIKSFLPPPRNPQHTPTDKLTPHFAASLKKNTQCFCIFCTGDCRLPLKTKKWCYQISICRHFCRFPTIPTACRSSGNCQTTFSAVKSLVFVCRDFSPAFPHQFPSTSHLVDTLKILLNLPEGHSNRPTR